MAIAIPSSATRLSVGVACHGTGEAMGLESNDPVKKTGIDHVGCSTPLSQASTAPPSPGGSLSSPQWGIGSPKSTMWMCSQLPDFELEPLFEMDPEGDDKLGTENDHFQDLVKVGENGVEWVQTIGCGAEEHREEGSNRSQADDRTKCCVCADSAQDDPVVQVAMSRSNCVIFDWDDTLFPATAAGLPGGIGFATKALQGTIRKLLEAALNFAPDATYIVTNANDGWVESCTARYFPGLLSLLEDVHVVSARKYFRDWYGSPGRRHVQSGDDCLRWKTFAMQSLADDGAFGLRDSLGAPLNLVALGDVATDTLAAQALHACLPNSSWLKTVQLSKAPSLSYFLEQMQLIQGEFGGVCAHEGSASICVACCNCEAASSGPDGACGDVADSELVRGPTLDWSSTEHLVFNLDDQGTNEDLSALSSLL